MIQLLHQCMPVALELASLKWAFIILIMGLFFPKLRSTSFFGILSSVILTLILVFGVIVMPHVNMNFINSFYTVDPISLYFKLIFIIAALLVSLMSISYLKPFTSNRGDYYSLIFFALTGMMVMASATELITLYIGLEFMTFTFILLTAYKKADLKSGEAGLKYLILSAVSSAVFLFGLSFLYGLTGTLEFTALATALSTGTPSLLLISAVIMVLAGLSFKLALVPLHMWAPDIYEGAPAPITAFLAVGSKAAALIAFIRLFFKLFALQQAVFIPLLIVIAILTMVIGNLIALAQTHLKRLLAYSSIAHAGYLLLGVIAYTQMGLSAILFYITLYLFANIGVFAGIVLLVNQTGHDHIEDLGGLWKRSPFTAAVLLICLLSLAGIPPTAGFIGKFYLFTETIHKGYLWLAMIGVGMSLVSIYYYIVIIRTMLSGGKDMPDGKVSIPFSLRLVMLISAGMTLLLGIAPAMLTDYVMKLGQLFLG